MTTSRFAPARAQALPALASATVLVTLELVRASGPLLDTAFAAGVLTVAATALATYAAPGLVLLLLGTITLVAARRGRLAHAVRVDHSRVALVVGVAALVALRLAVQAVDGDARVVLGLLAVACALAVTTLAVGATARARGAASAAAAVGLGAATSAGLTLALGTWDAVWRHDALGWGVAIAQGGLLLATVLVALAAPRPAHEATTSLRPPTRALWLLGPALGLGSMSVLNPAFAASQSGLPLAVAGPVLGGGLLVSVALVVHCYRTAVPADVPGADPAGHPRTGPRATLARALAPLLAPLGVVGVYWLDGYLTLGSLVLAQVGVLAGLALAWSGPRPVSTPRAVGSRRALARWLGTGVGAGLGTVLPILVFQLDYDVPLPFPNRFVPVAVAVLVATTAAVLGGGDHVADVEAHRRAARRGPAPVSLARHRTRDLVPAALAAVVLVLVGSALAVAHQLRTDETISTATAAAGEGDGSGTLLSWNLHYGVDPAGALDLEAVARTIEQHTPDVVALQEVSRGWILGGGADAATWLAHRLGMDVEFAPAADRQFGNAILTRTGVDHAHVTELPYGDGPQRRSALTATTALGRVTSTHLQHRDENTMTRQLQITALLDQLADGPRLPTGPGSDIIAGDFNAQPGWAEMDMLLTTGWFSALDEVGQDAALTFPSSDPAVRIDWVLGHGVRFTTGEVLTDALASDHLPIVVTVERD